MTDQPTTEVFGPGHREWCPAAPDDDPGHCSHWYDCEPCDRCGDDTPDPDCDCARCWAARFFRPGRFPDQTILADPAQPDVMGNCWQTCIAGILDLPLDEVPHFVQDHQSMADVEAATRAWALRLGFAMVKLPVLEVDANADFALTLLCGTSPRDVNHAVIGRGTEVLHDPHPSKAGLSRITDAFAFLALDPSARRPVGAATSEVRAQLRPYVDELHAFPDSTELRLTARLGLLRRLHAELNGDA